MINWRRMASNLSTPKLAATRNAARESLENLFKVIIYPNATSSIIITTKPSIAPAVAISVF